MKYLDIATTQVHVGAGGTSAPVIYVIDSSEHPFVVETLTRGRTATIVTIPVTNWNDALTPWPAAGIYRGEADFGGQAAETLAELLDEVMPAVEADAELSPAARALCGYSLGGLFALFALTHADTFAAAACLSGSVWYEGWVEHLRALPLDLSGHFAYLSLGTKERKAARPILKTVQDCMEQCASILRGDSCQVVFRTGPGNHMQHVNERLSAGLHELDAFLNQLPHGEDHRQL